MLTNPRDNLNMQRRFLWRKKPMLAPGYQNPEETVKIMDDRARWPSEVSFAKQRRKPSKAWRGILRAALFVFVLVLLLGMICYVVLILQWKAVMQALQPPILWNTTLPSEEAPLSNIQKLETRQHRARRHSNRSEFENITTSVVPMGLYFEPYPKPVIFQKQTLGLPVVLHFDSSQMAKQYNLASKEAHQRLVTLLNEEMQSLWMENPHFEIPFGGPEEQSSYQEMMCYENFGHCYLVDFGMDRIWPTNEIVADHCERPHHEKTVKENSLPQWYLNITTLDYGYSLHGRYEGAKREEYRIPGGKRSAKAAVFCTTALYQWAGDQQTGDKDKLAQGLAKCLQNETTGELKDACLPPEWHDRGQGLLFREMTDEDFCKRPRFPAFLNRTYFEQSCTAMWCEEQKELICTLPESEDWDCFFCSWNISEVGWSHKKDLPHWDRAKRHAPWCVKAHRVTEANYAVYSLMQLCTSQARHASIDVVVSLLRQLLAVQQEAVDFPCDQKESRCTLQSVPDMVQAEAVWVLNDTFLDFWERVSKGRGSQSLHQRVKKGISAGVASRALISKAIKVLSRLSDVNDQTLKGGILLIKKYLISAFSIIKHDFSTFSDALTIQSLHVQVMKCVLQLSQEKAPWPLINQTEIQQALRLSEEQMQIVRHTAKAYVYKVKKQRDETSTKVWNPEIASRWSVYFYLELHIPGEFYMTNWKLKNVGWLVATGKHLGLSHLLPPFQFVSFLRGQQRFLSVHDCVDYGYLFCEEITETAPCNTRDLGGNCPVTLQPVNSSYLKVEPLKNGSYLILSGASECGVAAYKPAVVTLDTHRVCFGQELSPPPEPPSLSQPVTINIPILHLHFPLLAGIIANLKELKIELFNTYDPVDKILERAERELLSSNVHERRWPEWLGFLNEALSQLGPGASTALQLLTQLMMTLSEGALGTVFDFLYYFKFILMVFLSVFFTSLIAQFYKK